MCAKFAKMFKTGFLHSDQEFADWQKFLADCDPPTIADLYWENVTTDLSHVVQFMKTKHVLIVAGDATFAPQTLRQRLLTGVPPHGAHVAVLPGGTHCLFYQAELAVQLVELISLLISGTLKRNTVPNTLWSPPAAKYERQGLSTSPRGALHLDSRVSPRGPLSIREDMLGKTMPGSLLSLQRGSQSLGPPHHPRHSRSRSPTKESYPLSPKSPNESQSPTSVPRRLSLPLPNIGGSVRVSAVPPQLDGSVRVLDSQLTPKTSGSFEVRRAQSSITDVRKLGHHRASSQHAEILCRATSSTTDLHGQSQGSRDSCIPANVRAAAFGGSFRADAFLSSMTSKEGQSPSSKPTGISQNQLSSSFKAAMLQGSISVVPASPPPSCSIEASARLRSVSANGALHKDSVASSSPSLKGVQSVARRPSRPDCLQPSSPVKTTLLNASTFVKSTPRDKSEHQASTVNVQARPRSFSPLAPKEVPITCIPEGEAEVVKTGATSALTPTQGGQQHQSIPKTPSRPRLLPTNEGARQARTPPKAVPSREAEPQMYVSSAADDDGAIWKMFFKAALTLSDSLAKSQTSLAQTGESKQTQVKEGMLQARSSTPPTRVVHRARSCCSLKADAPLQHSWSPVKEMPKARSCSPAPGMPRARSCSALEVGEQQATKSRLITPPHGGQSNLIIPTTMVRPSSVPQSFASLLQASAAMTKPAEQRTPPRSCSPIQAGAAQVNKSQSVEVPQSCSPTQAGTTQANKSFSVEAPRSCTPTKRGTMQASASEILTPPTPRGGKSALNAPRTTPRTPTGSPVVWKSVEAAKAGPPQAKMSPLATPPKGGQPMLNPSKTLQSESAPQSFASRVQASAAMTSRPVEEGESQAQSSPTYRVGMPQAKKSQSVEVPHSCTPRNAGMPQALKSASVEVPGPFSAPTNMSPKATPPQGGHSTSTAPSLAVRAQSLPLSKAGMARSNASIITKPAREGAAQSRSCSPINAGTPQATTSQCRTPPRGGQSTVTGPNMAVRTQSVPMSNAALVRSRTPQADKVQSLEEALRSCSESILKTGSMTPRSPILSGPPQARSPSSVQAGSLRANISQGCPSPQGGQPMLKVPNVTPRTKSLPPGKALEPNSPFSSWPEAKSELEALTAVCIQLTAKPKASSGQNGAAPPIASSSPLQHPASARETLRQRSLTPIKEGLSVNVKPGKQGESDVSTGASTSGFSTPQKPNQPFSSVSTPPSLPPRSRSPVKAAAPANPAHARSRSPIKSSNAVLASSPPSAQRRQLAAPDPHQPSRGSRPSQPQQPQQVMAPKASQAQVSQRGSDQAALEAARRMNVSTTQLRLASLLHGRPGGSIALSQDQRLGGSFALPQDQRPGGSLSMKSLYVAPQGTGSCNTPGVPRHLSGNFETSTRGRLESRPKQQPVPITSVTNRLDASMRQLPQQQISTVPVKHVRM